MKKKCPAGCTNRPHLLDDSYLKPYEQAVRGRAQHAEDVARRLAGSTAALADWASGHEYFGLHRVRDGWAFREWAPNATGIWLVGDFTKWKRRRAFRCTRLENGVWECRLPDAAIRHGDHYRLDIAWKGGEGERIPAYARYVVQDPDTNLFSAQVWSPAKPYAWKNPRIVESSNRRIATENRKIEKSKNRKFEPLLIYEAHVGMASEEEKVASYAEFRENVLPRIKKAGYNTVQLMGVMEHPYYGSFGYHVSSFFACSSRFGTPDDFKALVDAAHGMGLRVIIDLVHSHAVKNARDGLSCFDGTETQYFHGGSRGWHSAWDSRCFDYGKTEVLHFLLSNCRFWLDEYRIDGFRFDGVTSMLYYDHGLGTAFTGYPMYFNGSMDDDAWVYLNLANRVIHAVRPDAVTIAEDVSGLPGCAAPAEDCGLGFDYRMAMGQPDAWFRLAEKVRDDDWSMGGLFYMLTDRRAEERVVSYVESHDQALVGGKTFFFQLADAAVYYGMGRDQHGVEIDRAIALHKMARLATLAANGGAYLNFMGNEFGHPEWIDFPREGNGHSYAHARRQWSLRDNPALHFHELGDFDAAMLACVAGADFGDVRPVQLCADEGDKVLAFVRGNLLFAFNFNPSKSFADYGILVPPATAWRHALDTDEPRFGGQGRIASGGDYLPSLVPYRGELVQQIRLYLPARTAVVLVRKVMPH